MSRTQDNRLNEIKDDIRSREMEIKSLDYQISSMKSMLKELIVDGICWFPRMMRWQTSKEEVAPVFSDYRNEGYEYRLVAYRNLVTKEQYSIESVQKEIGAENRIGTLE